MIDLIITLDEQANGQQWLQAGANDDALPLECIAYLETLKDAGLLEDIIK